MAARIVNSRCVLAVRDLEVSTRYYIDVLGFTKDPINGAGWSFLTRDCFHVMLGECIGERPAGTATGETYETTELNLFSNDPGPVDDLINQMCSLGFAHNGNYCNTDSDPLIGAPHPTCLGNFRAPGTTDSLQVNTKIQGGGAYASLDVDPYNPSDGVLGAVLHNLLQVLPNAVRGTDNTYGCTR